ncbi:aminoacyl-tRNA hydrolase [Hominifimenecus sp. rT4P-3]|uniref:aminoacyl-tRNA hydrolase n=1 Tax=Hominifimenecus sp. rT4P-3 TaxID=3242979 RepID=UPI003DA69F84
MKLIVGLGNPAAKYEGTRHNIGFSVIDRLAEAHGIRVNTNRQKGLCGTGILAGEKVMLVKPLTFMNLSGECIRPLMDYYKLEPSELLVIYDDISLEPGQIRIRAKGSAGGHNGIKSILAHLGTQEFPRIKVGVGGKPEQMDLADYVLGHFNREEQAAMAEAVKLAAEAAEVILTDGIKEAMNRFNAFKRKEEHDGEL